MKSLNCQPKGNVTYQVMPPLSAEEYQALKDDIAKRGVLVPVEKDENGTILDGHHRIRAWDELQAEGVNLEPYPVITRAGLSEADKLNHARAVNILRRHLSAQQRKPIFILLRQAQWSYRRIATETGTPITTVERMVAGDPNGSPATVQGKDGKEYPARIPADEPKSAPHVAHNSGDNEWYTPPEFIDAARDTMGTIDLDPASSTRANETVKAMRFFGIDDDGRKQPWNGNVWMNPPYAQPLIAEFAALLVRNHQDGNVPQACVLVNNATETAWFQELLIASTAICLIRGRVKFIDTDGKPNGAPLQGQAILYIGSNVKGFASNFSKFGVILYA